MPREYVLEPFRAPVDLQIDYARELNPQQLTAVQAPPGPALVIAGAGAGKTRTLIYRVAYLLEQGVPARNILLLTFTNKAAREMMRRVDDLLSHDTAALWGGTFHAIGLRVLRRHAALLGYAPDFAVLDRADAEDLLEACLEETGGPTEKLTFPQPPVVAGIYSWAANTRQPLAEAIQGHAGLSETAVEPLRALRDRYAARKRAAGLMDFDDLLALWFKLLEDHAEVREHYQRRFQFILVDEYQDTNQLQGDLVDLLAARHHGVMAVGDDAQSIYSWRGANFRNILVFPERHPGTQVYKIETNYRSTPEILDLANAAIAPNTEQYVKILQPVRPSGMRPARVACLDARIQALFVAQRALQLRDEGVSLGHMAVLYRSHFHALELQLELRRRQIPFSITSGIRFFEQAHIKDVAAGLRLLCNPQDELAFKRVVKLLPGVGPKGAERLWRRFSAALTHAAAAAATVEQPGPPAAPAIEAQPGAPGARLAGALAAVEPLVPRKAWGCWGQFTASLVQLEQAARDESPQELIGLAVESLFGDFIREHYENAHARLEDLEQLGLAAQSAASLPDFLAEMALLSNVEAEGAAKPRPDEDGVRLSTVHQAKGLEFGVVFVIMLCEGMFPARRAAETPAGEEEERRLFYVALTRARDELYLCHPSVRVTRGSGEESVMKPSRFLAALPSGVYEDWDLVHGVGE